MSGDSRPSGRQLSGTKRPRSSSPDGDPSAAGGGEGEARENSGGGRGVHATVGLPSRTEERLLPPAPAAAVPAHGRSGEDPNTFAGEFAPEDEKASVGEGGGAHEGQGGMEIVPVGGAEGGSGERDGPNSTGQEDQGRGVSDEEFGDSNEVGDSEHGEPTEPEETDVELSDAGAGSGDDDEQDETGEAAEPEDEEEGDCSSASDVEEDDGVDKDDDEDDEDDSDDEDDVVMFGFMAAVVAFCVASMTMMALLHRRRMRARCHMSLMFALCTGLQMSIQQGRKEK